MTSQSPSTRAKPERTRRGRRLLAALALVVGTALSATVPLHSSTAGAQARQVSVTVLTTPAIPKAGGTTSVDVVVHGCPMVPTTVELYLASTDGKFREAFLIDRTAATTTLIGRVIAHLNLKDALRGWYGIRVICGTYRPPKEPIPNSLFGVGVGDEPAITVAPHTARRGGSVELSGRGCEGTSVEYAFTDGNRYPGEFQPAGSSPVAADGSWNLTASIGPAAITGAGSFQVRCVSTNKDGDAVHSNYDQWLPITIEADN